MAEDRRFENENLSGASFHNCALANASFDDVTLSRASFSNVRLDGAHFADVDLTGVVIDYARIDGLTILGHDVGKLIEAVIAQARASDV